MHDCEFASPYGAELTRSPVESLQDCMQTGTRGRHAVVVFDKKMQLLISAAKLKGENKRADSVKLSLSGTSWFMYVGHILWRQSGRRAD